MKTLVNLLLFLFLLAACREPAEYEDYAPIDWESKKTELSGTDSLTFGKTYLPVYSHIYDRYEHKTFDLTITISMRNISVSDTLYLLRADYYNTGGENIRQYVRFPVQVLPMETLEIIIEQDDKEGGSGANFLFDWAIRNGEHAPLFEAVMISTYGGQGLSFSTRGVRMDEDEEIRD